MVILKNISKDKKLSQNFDHIKSAIQKNDIYLLKESRIVFTCGAAAEGDYMKTRRGILMQYARKNIKGINFFTAETLFDTMEDHKTTDLLSIESRLANYSDCILIILESPGAFAELGVAISVQSRPPISDQAMPLSIMISTLPAKNNGSKMNRHYGSQTTFTAQTQRNL